MISPRFNSGLLTFAVFERGAGAWADTVALTGFSSASSSSRSLRELRSDSESSGSITAGGNLDGPAIGGSKDDSANAGAAAAAASEAADSAARRILAALRNRVFCFRIAGVSSCSMMIVPSGLLTILPGGIWMKV